MQELEGYQDADARHVPKAKSCTIAGSHRDARAEREKEVFKDAVSHARELIPRLFSSHRCCGEAFGEEGMCKQCGNSAECAERMWLNAYFHSIQTAKVNAQAPDVT